MTIALPPWASQIAVFDTETTGVNPATARIVSAAIAVLDAQGAVLERYDWLLNPGVPIPPEAMAVHGITEEIVATSGIDAAIGVAQISARISEVVERGLAIVAYNAPYDLTLLRAEQHRYGVPLSPVFPVLDPLVIDKQMDRYRRGKRQLTMVAEHYGVELSAAHDAGEDAIASGRLLQKIAAKFANKLPSDVAELHQAQISWEAAQTENFQNYMRQRNPGFIARGGWPLQSESQ